MANDLLRLNKDEESHQSLHLVPRFQSIDSAPNRCLSKHFCILAEG
jgi:hypothetical protein